MDKLVARALHRFLSIFVKNFSPEKLRNFELVDAELNEDVLQEILLIPPNIRVTGAHVDHCAVKVPFKRIRHDPVVVTINKVFLTVSEPDVLLPVASVMSTFAPKKKDKNTPRKRTLVDKIIDGLTVHVNEIVAEVRLLDHGRVQAPVLTANIHGFTMHCTNQDWKVVDLRLARMISKGSTEILVFREILLKAVTVIVEPPLPPGAPAGQGGKVLLENVPLSIKMAVKSFLLGDLTSRATVDAELSEWSATLEPEEWKLIADFVLCLMGCFDRRLEVEHAETAHAYARETAEAQEKVKLLRGQSTASVAQQPVKPQTRPRKQTAWKKLKTMLGKTPEEVEAEREAPVVSLLPPPPAVVAEDVTGSDTTSTVGSTITDLDRDDILEAELEGEDGAPIVFTDTQDIKQTTVNVHLGQAKVFIRAPVRDVGGVVWVVGPDEGGLMATLAEITVERLLLRALPMVQGAVDRHPLIKNETEVQLMLGNATIRDTLRGVAVRSAPAAPASLHHDDSLLITSGSPDEHDHLIQMKWVSRTVRTLDLKQISSDLGKSFFRRTLDLAVSNLYCSVERECLFRLFDFSLTPEWRGMSKPGNDGLRQLRERVEATVERWVEAVLYNQVRFSIEARDTFVFIPPGGGFRNRVHLSAQTLEIEAPRVVLASSEPLLMPVFAQGLFHPVDQLAFPTQHDDFASPKDSLPFAPTECFKLLVQDVVAGIRPAPGLDRLAMLEPTDLSAELLVRHQTSNECSWGPQAQPQLIMQLKLGSVVARLTQPQYLFLVGLSTERFSFQPLKDLRAAAFADAKAPEAGTSDPVVVVFDPELAEVLREGSATEHAPPLLYQVNARVDNATLELITETQSTLPTGPPPGAQAAFAGETLAVLHCRGIDMVLEGQAAKTVVKVELKYVDMASPGTDSPFPELFRPMAPAAVTQRLPSGPLPPGAAAAGVDGDAPRLRLRMEQLKQPHLVPRALLDSGGRSFSKLPRDGEPWSREVPNPPPSPNMAWVEMYGMWACLVMETLVRLQLFFSDYPDLDVVGVPRMHRKRIGRVNRLSKLRSDTDWSVSLWATEALVLETATTVECLPLDLSWAWARRRAVNVGFQELIDVQASGATLNSLLIRHQAATLARHPLSLPLGARVSYWRSRASLSNKFEWTANVAVEELSVTMTRPQFLLLLNIGESQLGTLKRVNEIFAEEEERVRQAGRVWRERVWLVLGGEGAPPTAVPVVADDDDDDPTPAMAVQEGRVTSRIQLDLNRLSVHLRKPKSTSHSAGLDSLLEDVAESSDFVRIEGGGLGISQITTDRGVQTRLTISLASMRVIDVESEKAAGRFPVIVAAKGAPSAPESRRRSSLRRRAGSTRHRLSVRPRADSFPHAAHDGAPVFKLTLTDSPSQDTSQPRENRWDFEVEPLVIVYAADVVKSCTDFFALLEEQKEVRLRYRAAQQKLGSILAQGLLQDEPELPRGTRAMSRRLGRTLSMHGLSEALEAEQAALPPPPPKSRPVLIFKVAIRGPSVLFPGSAGSASPGSVGAKAAAAAAVAAAAAAGARTGADVARAAEAASLAKVAAGELAAVLELSVEAVIGSNENVYFPGVPDVSRTEYMAGGVEVLLRTLDPRANVTRVNVTPIVLPMTAQLAIMSKRNAVGGVPYVLIEAGIDPVRATVSLEKGRTIFGIAERYVRKLAATRKREPAKPRVGVAGRAIAAAEGAKPPKQPHEPPGKAMELRIEALVTNLDVALTSDYVDGLKLAFLYGKDLEVGLSLFRGSTSFEARGRLELLMNNLDFMTPEPLLEPFTVAISGSHQRTANGETLELDAVGLDVLRAQVSRDMLRHILEIRDLVDRTFGAVKTEEQAAEERLNKSDLVSHFHYVLDNQLECPVYFSQVFPRQSQLADFRVLPAGDQTSFSFSNPYLPKRLVTTLSMDWGRSRPFSVDEAGIVQVQLSLSNAPVVDRSSKRNTANLLPGIMRRGQRRRGHESGPQEGLMSLLPWSGPSSRAVAADDEDEDEDDEDISSLLTVPDKSPTPPVTEPAIAAVIGSTRTIVVRIRPRGLKRLVEFLPSHSVANDTDGDLEIATTGVGDRRSYDCPSGKSVPILHSDDWDSHRFSLRPSSEWDWSDPFIMPGPKDVQRVPVFSRQLDTMRMFMVHARTVEKTGVRELVVSPPFVIHNKCVFPIEYYFPSLDRGGAVLASSSKSFFFDTVEHPLLSLRANEYEEWSEPVDFSDTAESQVVMKRRVVRATSLDNLKARASVSLSMKVMPFLPNKKGRAVYIATQILFVNNTDLLLFIKQAHSGEVIELPPASNRPFSWDTGARTVSVKLGNGQWSSPLNIYLKDTSIVRVEMTDLHMQYELLMDVRAVGGSSRVVTWAPRLRFHNQVHRNLVVLVGRVIVPIAARSDVESTVVDQHMVVSVKEGPWSYEHFPADKEGVITVKIRSTDRVGRFYPLDITVRVENYVTHVYFSESVAPPYVLYNATQSSLAVTQSTMDRSERVLVPPGTSAPFYWTVQGVERQIRVLVLRDEGEQRMHEAMNTLSQGLRGVRIGGPSFDDESGDEKPSKDTGSEKQPLLGAGAFGASRGSRISPMEIAVEPTEVESYGGVSTAAEDDRSAPESESLDRWQVVGGSVDDIAERWSTPFGIDHLTMNSVQWPPRPEKEEVDPSMVVMIRARGRSKLVVFSESRGMQSQSVGQEAARVIGRLLGGVGSAVGFAHLFGDVGTSGGAAAGVTAGLARVRSHPRLPTHILLASEGLAHTPGGTTMRQEAAQVQEGDDEGDVSPLVVHMRARVPQLEGRLLGDSERDELVHLTVLNSSVQWRRGLAEEHAYVTIRDMQIDNLMAGAVYQVLMASDRRQLEGVRANVLESLLVWSTHEGFRFVDYLGVRVLPLHVRWDDAVMVELQRMAEFSSSAKPAKEELPVVEDKGSLEDILKQEKRKLYVEEVVIFPVTVDLCIGENELGLPPIHDGVTLQLALFTRSDLYDPTPDIAGQVVQSYARGAWTEVLKLAASLDVFGSPLSAASKLGEGLRDFVVYPFTSLVLDDTPGAFVVGLSRGSASLAMNATDATTSVIQKVAAQLGHLAAVLSFDDDYLQDKQAAMRRRAPNALYGLGAGAWELGRGVISGVGGVVYQPYLGARQAGPVGFAVGVGKGIIGVPVKSIGSVFDLGSKTLEGLRNTFKTGVGVARMQRPRGDPTVARQQVGAVKDWLTRRKDGEKYSIHQNIHLVTRRGRVRERLLVLTNRAVHFFNVRRMYQPEGYQPRTVFLTQIRRIVAPNVPETVFVLELSRIVQRRDRLEIMAPDRRLLIARIAQLQRQGQATTLLQIVPTPAPSEANDIVGWSLSEGRSAQAETGAEPFFEQWAERAGHEAQVSVQAAAAAEVAVQAAAVAIRRAARTEAFEKQVSEAKRLHDDVAVKAAAVATAKAATLAAKVAEEATAAEEKLIEWE